MIRMVRPNVIRHENFAEMNRVHADYFPDGKYSARTTTIVARLPSIEFLNAIGLTRSYAARRITGTVIPVDGGEHLTA
jgi:enamine deaminase RidA (YjgF/YER057c/UK114 family)